MSRASGNAKRSPDLDHLRVAPARTRSRTRTTSRSWSRSRTGLGSWC